MNNDVCASLGDLFDALSESIEKKDIIYAKTTSQIVSSLIKERFKRNMTQHDFAEQLNIKQSMVSRWESGSSNFTIKTLSKIAADLDLDLYINLIPNKEVQYIHTEHYRTMNPAQPSRYNAITSKTPNRFEYKVIYASAKKTHTTHKEVSNW